MVDKTGVHITHCCVLHGCKYGDKDCPVVIGSVDQRYLCESCSSYIEEDHWWDRIKQSKRKIQIEKIVNG